MMASLLRVLLDNRKEECFCMSCMGCLWAVRRPIFLNPPIRFGVLWPPKCGQTWHNFGGGVFPWSQGAASGRIIPEIHFENFSRNLSIQFEIWHGKWRHSSCKTLNALHFIPFADNCCRSHFAGSLFFKWIWFLQFVRQNPSREKRTRHRLFWSRLRQLVYVTPHRQAGRGNWVRLQLE